MTNRTAAPRLKGLSKPDAGEIHLWHLASSSAVEPGFYTVGENFLSAEERNRLAAMKHPRPAARFLRGRILARRVLGGYLLEDPRAVELVVDGVGKPSVGSTSESSLAFSLSHADEETILAVAADGDIGVDVEALTKASAAMRIAREFYTDPELRSLDHIGGDKLEAALKLWTLKESIVKARGQTVWDGLKGVDLTIEGDEFRWHVSPPERDRWCLAAGRFGPTYCLAVAWRMPDVGRAISVTFKRFGVDGALLPGEVFEPDFVN